MDQILDLVGEHRRVRSDNYLTTVSTSWMGSEGRPSARAGGEPTSQGCEAGLETRTHTGEAVPCHLLCMQVGKPGRPSGCFGRDSEYALNKSNRIPARGKSCFDGYAAVAVEQMRLGNIRSAYAICLGCCCCSPMQGLITTRCEECRLPRWPHSRASRQLSSSFSHAPLAIFRRQSGMRCPDLGALLVDLPLRPEEEIEKEVHE